MSDAAPLLDGMAGAGMQARSVALSLLSAILLKKTALDQALERERGFANLPQQDRAFVRMLVTTALRRKGQMDDLIHRAMERGEPRPETLRLILYIGLTQILFMDVPDHAAVDTSVRLAEQSGLSKQKSFVNAVLRRMTSEGREWEKRQDFVRLNIPDWILQSWIADYGLTQALSIAEASLSPAALDITVKNQTETALWQGALEASVLPTGSLRRSSVSGVRDLKGFHEGAWWVQDAAAALPVSLLGDVQGKRAVDLCAAPGGKTMQLAASGAQVTAVDRSTTRMRLLKENLARTKLESAVECVIADGAEWKTTAPVDIMLIDAPCSATGTVRRHPDLLHLKTPKDVDSLLAVQTRLMDHAADFVADGGTLIYCTCSLQKAEGEEQVLSFLSRHPEYALFLPESEQLASLRDMGAVAETEAGDMIRILPSHMAALGGIDGFFIAFMRRTSGV